MFLHSLSIAPSIAAIRFPGCAAGLPEHPLHSGVARAWRREPNHAYLDGFFCGRRNRICRDRRRSRRRLDDRKCHEPADAAIRQAGSAYGVALSGDPQQRFLYVADGSDDHIAILDRNTLETIGQIGRPASPPQSAMPPQHPAITPLAIPIIVTPWGVAAILFFADLAYDDLKMWAIVIGILLIVMLMNLVGMLLAKQIVARVGMISFQVLGWIFAVLQTGFAVDAVVTSVRNLALFNPIP